MEITNECSKNAIAVKKVSPITVGDLLQIIVE